MGCGAMPLPPRKNVNVRLFSHTYLPSISSLRDCALPIFVIVSSLYHPFRFVPYQWGSFFNKFQPFRFEYPSCEGIEYAYFSPISTRVPLLKGYGECISCICNVFADLAIMRWIPLIQSFHIYAHATQCSLTILKPNVICIALKECKEQQPINVVSSN